MKDTSLPAAPLCRRPAREEDCCFPSWPAAATCFTRLPPRLLARGSCYATLASWPRVPERPQRPANPAPRPSRPGQGLAPQPSAGWSRRRARGPAIGPGSRLTWSRAVKRPPGPRTRDLPELRPHGDSRETGASSRKPRRAAAPLPDELHQVGSRQILPPGAQGERSCREAGMRFPAVIPALETPGEGGLTGC